MTDRGRYLEATTGQPGSRPVWARFSLFSVSPPFRPKLHKLRTDLQKSFSGLQSPHQGPTCGAMTSILLLKIHAKKKKGRGVAYFID
jgi:hypothetical protein